MIEDEDIRMMLHKIMEDEKLSLEFSRAVLQVLPNYTTIETICKIMIEKDEQLKNGLRRRNLRMR